MTLGATTKERKRMTILDALETFQGRRVSNSMLPKRAVLSTCTMVAAIYPLDATTEKEGGMSFIRQPKNVPVDLYFIVRRKKEGGSD